MIKYFLLSLLMTATASTLFAQSRILTPRVDKPVYFDISPPLRDLVQQASRKADKSWKDGVVQNYFDPRIGAGQKQGIPGFTDPVLQSQPGMLPSDTTLQNFDGLSAGGSVPPDTHGEVGPNHFFQVVNTIYAIYNKTGQKILGPLPSSLVWNGMPNNANSGDAVVLYDENANRWLFTQFSLPNYPSGPFLQMIAVSQTPDPTGSWYRWEYVFGQMPDYPKFGVWPDGYYMSANRFAGGWTGTGAYGYDRTAMLAGNPNAQRISFEFQLSGEGFITMLPSDCDGTFPPAGTPNYFTFVKTGGSQHLGIYEFHADWTTPANATFGNNVSLPVTPFATLSGGVPQKDTPTMLDGISDRLMYSQKYRVFNGYNTMVLNHTVSATAGVAGVRWYELRKPGSNTWSIYQQSTYSLPDNNSRWMGSIAIDTAGTIALGYSVSGPNMHPAIRYTGRFKNDPLNTMTLAEKTIIQGGGSQTGVWSGRSRWGDYSAMSVDPAAPTTFWYTTEYYATTSPSNWQTRVGSFTFGNTFSLSASVYPATYCNGDSATLHAFAYGGSANFTYAWSSEPAGFTSNLPNPVVHATATTKYTVSVSDGSQTRTDTTRLTVHNPPTAFAGNDTTVCIYLSSLDIHGVATDYRVVGWGSTGDGHFTTTTGLNTTYFFGQRDKAADSVEIEMVALPNAPCTGNVFSHRIIKFDPCTGIGEIREEKLSLKVMPNPARESVTITLAGLAKQGATLSVTSLEGQKLMSDYFSPAAKPVMKQIDLSGFRKGIYIIQLKTDTEVKTERLIVQ